MTGILNALIAGVSGAVKDAYFNLVSLLLPGNGTNGAQNNTFLDSSSNTFTITRNGNTTQGTFSPFSQTGWGNYFSGSGQYLSLADNAAYALSNGNFTAEAWVYKPASGRAMIMGQGDGASATNTSFFFQVNASDKLEGIVTISSTDYTVTASATFLLNQWVHVALVRTGPNLAIYINGSKDGEITTLSTNSLNDSPSVFSVGAFGSYGSFRWSGYISNARLVKGVAVYTGNFTPPISPLTATQSAGTNISAITGTQTSLLTCQSNRFIDNSVANSGAGFTITPNGSPSVTPFSPFAPTQSYSAAAVGGSGYFDGTGDYLSAPSSTNLLLNGVDSTIEGWYYLNASPGTPGTSTPFFCQGNTGSGTSGNSNFWCFADATTLYFGGGGDSSSLSTSVSVVPIKQWFHLAVVITAGTSANVYINGSSVVSGSGMVAVGSTTSRTTLVGYMMSGSSVVSNLNGYCSGFRIVKGTAITPPSGGPTSPPTAVSGTSLLLNFTNAGVVDATAKNVLETAGNAQISTTQSKWGGGSIYLPQVSTTDYLKEPSTIIFSGDFVIEGWIYFSSSSTGFPSLFSGTTSSQLQLQFNSTGATYYFSFGGSTIINAQASGLSTDTWTHFAIVRSGTATNNISVYFGGTRKNQATSTATVTQALLIGVDGSAANPFKGYVDDLRITLGNTRGYSGASITVPSAPFPLQ